MSQRNIDDLLNELEQELQKNDLPKPNDSARAQAILKANQTFDQAFDESARPIEKSTDSLFRSLVMSIFSKRPLSQKYQYAFGTLAAVGIAVPVLLSYKPNVEPAGVISIPAELQPTQPTQNKPIDSVVTVQPITEQDSTLEEVVVSGSRVNTQATPSRTDSLNRAEVKSAPTTPVTTSPAKPAPTAPLAVVETEMAADSFADARGRSQPASAKLKKAELRQQNATGLIRPLGASVAPEPPVSTTRPDHAEEYADYKRSSIVQVSDQPISTFSADVDTASYSLVRNQITQGYLPAHTAVRPEEFINYFNYDYPTAESKSRPFEPTVTLMDSPWNTDKKLVHIGIKGYDLEPNKTPDSNIVFLIDVSGSMSAANKLPLAKQSIMFLADQLKPTDKISVAVYAGAAGVVLEPTAAKDKAKLKSALSKLNAGGSTAGGAGIELAYQLADQNFEDDAVNRIVLLTDGDFNVGQSSNQQLLEMVERKRESGVLLSVLGFGRNNYQDDMMQTLAQNGNGIAAYIDTLNEAKKVLVDEATSTLFPIAKDVKFQVEFNPATVADYRLVGYETRALRTEDFNNDKVDAGDIGAGHTVTAIYEITPMDAKQKSIDAPRYAGNQAKISSSANSNEYGFVKVRYKLPKADKSTLIETPIRKDLASPSQDARFSIAVAAFAQLLSGSKHIGAVSYDQIAEFAKANKGNDAHGYRAEFIQLVEMAGLIE